MRKIFVINGPNLNLLGTRESRVYGIMTLRQIVRMLKSEARKRRIRIGRTVERPSTACPTALPLWTSFEYTVTQT